MSGVTVVDAAGVERVKGVSFEVRRGEIVGIAGVAGNGQSGLPRGAGGNPPAEGGANLVAGQCHHGRGFALAPEDALARPLPRPRGPPADGSRGSLPLAESAILGYHDEPTYNRHLRLRRTAVAAGFRRQAAEYDIRPGTDRFPRRPSRAAISRRSCWPASSTGTRTFLIVGQPTRGVDIGAIEFIHRRLVALRDAGKAILLVSVEVDEILALATASWSCTTGASSERCAGHRPRADDRPHDGGRATRRVTPADEPPTNRADQSGRERIRLDHDGPRAGGEPRAGPGPLRGRRDPGRWRIRSGRSGSSRRARSATPRPSATRSTTRPTSSSRAWRWPSPSTAGSTSAPRAKRTSPGSARCSALPRAGGRRSWSSSPPSSWPRSSGPPGPSCPPGSRPGGAATSSSRRSCTTSSPRP